MSKSVRSIVLAVVAALVLQTVLAVFWESTLSSENVPAAIF